MRIGPGRVAAVTGAASGIGAALAEELARRGSQVALCDVDGEGLDATRERCEELGAEVSVAAVDVADRAAVFAWADQVVAGHGAVHLVVNNAGVALGSTVAAMSPDDLEWLMGINFWGVVHGTQAFLPRLQASGEGHVVNISSVFGLHAIPSQSAYNASKFAVRGFTDALRMELELEGSPVSATTVHPGGIATNIARNARMDPSVAGVGADAERGRDEFERFLRTPPDAAARQILRAVERDRRRALVGPDAVAFDLLSRLPAGASQRLITAAVRAGASRSAESAVRPGTSASG